MASATVPQYTRSPFFRRTVGPSSMSHGVTTLAFPGLSILSCVPMAMNSSMMYMAATLYARDASPDVLALPYLSLNPPTAQGCPKMGRPATMSMRYFSLGSTLLGALESASFLSDLWASRNCPMNSHPFIPSLSTCFFSLDAF